MTFENILIMARSTSFFYMTMKIVGFITMSNPIYANSSNGHYRISSTIKNRNNFVSFGKWIIGRSTTNMDDTRDICRNVFQKKQSQIQSMPVKVNNENYFKVQGSEIRNQYKLNDKSMNSVSSSSTIPVRWEDQMVRKLQESCFKISEMAMERGKEFRSKLLLPTKLHQQTIVPTVISQDHEVMNNDDDESKVIVNSLTQPLIDENIWDKLDGTEFQRYPEIWNKLAKIGEKIATHDESNEWIDWNMYSNNENKVLNDGTTIHVWTGKSLKANVRGSHLPWIKTRSLIPFTPNEMVELLLDSKRVKSYNQWSLGRKDCWVANTIVPVLVQQEDVNNNPEEIPSPFSFTKIVKNRVQPPLGAKQMISTTLLHAQPCDSNRDFPSKEQSSNNDNSSTSNNRQTWIVVSRAVGGNAFYESEHDDDVGTSEMLFGINVIQPYDDKHSILTAVTHIYSSAVPTMLAERVGVKSAIKFVQDMRSLKEMALVVAKEKAALVATYTANYSRGQFLDRHEITFKPRSHDNSKLCTITEKNNEYIRVSSVSSESRSNVKG